jgi:hypothetical protein
VRQGARGGTADCVGFAAASPLAFRRATTVEIFEAIREEVTGLRGDVRQTNERLGAVAHRLEHTS